ncbi:MAG: adenylosuccinate synthetase, partial [Thermoleophilia bacterium]|nr:adenylosuccinate synthetase [Thermoleophilia bacterium]
MVKTAKVVIGAGFGDEGKGLITDYLASQQERGIVVRFNGGAQAGHTVVTPDGKRHVFGHVGAGSFAGLPTYLSRFFVANPMLFRKELASLQACCPLPTVYLDPRCPVTTPYDMIVNQVVELARGDSRHGSCGVGFNETVTRTLSGPALFVSDLADTELVFSILRQIRDEYVPHRLRKLGVNSVPETYARLLRGDDICERYLEDVRVLLSATAIADHRIFSSFEAVIFEGAQGLFLDETHRFFPYVTRSRTGLHNVVRLLGEAGLDGLRLEVVYVTRTYLTRHGPGPCPTETGDRPYP